MCVEALGITKRQLEDVLPAGKFEDMDECMKEQLMHRPLTNLVGESAFRDFDFDVCKRRNLYTIDPLCAVLKNKTVKFISSKSRSQINRLFGLARSRGKVLRKESVENKKEEIFHNLQISFLALEMVKKNSTKTNEIFSSNFQMT